MKLKKEKEENRVYEKTKGIQGQYRNWFLDYASYVILERAVPAIEDGLKPVQRRILHSMKVMDDGRFNKVANIIGQAMQYHPHGDASIGDALVNLGQKDFLVDTQGNWGDIRTGDSAAASRYIEARLSKFALEVAFNEKTTDWQVSYDGRKNEPVTLPMKFPLLLAQGAEGIAVGLSTKILPHNFCEICEAAVAYLKGLSFKLYPDFPTGGMVDVSNYQQGKRGGKVKVRANIEILDKKTLVIRSVPFGITTSSLADSITKANDLGKIKIKKVVDVTAENVELQVDLATGVSPDMTIDALYAFTDCEVNISPNACVIEDKKPRFLDVDTLLRHSVDKTKDLLKLELEIKLSELEEKWHYTSIEKIFFEQKIYRELEKKHNDWNTVIDAIAKDFEPFQKYLKRAIAREDLIKLTDKPVRHIYKLDIEVLDNEIKALESGIKQVKFDLAHLNEYCVTYFGNLLKKYGKGRERKTLIREFDTIEVQQVAMANSKLFVDRKEGFIGTGLKKDEFLFDCSDLDDIIVFTRKGIMKVVRAGDKIFIGKDILYVAIFRKNDERTTYNMIYLDGKTGTSYAKRFNVTSITREKEYDLTQGNERSRVLYFSANLNGEAESITVSLTAGCKAKKKEFEFSFENLDIKGRNSHGNILTRYPVRNIRFLSAGHSTLEGRKLWFDDRLGRLNSEENGTYLGIFEDENVIVFYKEGSYEIIAPEMTRRFDPEKVLYVERYDPEKIFTAVYLDAEKKHYSVKRFKIETTSLDSRFNFIREGAENELVTVTSNPDPVLIVNTGTGDRKNSAHFRIARMVEIMGWKALGAKLMGLASHVEMIWEKADETGLEQPELF